MRRSQRILFGSLLLLSPLAIVLWIALGLGALAGIGWGAKNHIDSASQDFVFEEIDEVPDRTVAIVPGARVYADGSPSVALEDRLRCALELYGEDKVKRILVSGDHGNHRYDEVNAMHRWLVDRGVLVDDVFLDHAGFRTFDTMARAARVFQVEDALICTQRFHQNRAVFLARTNGIDAVGLVADRRVYATAGADARRESIAQIRAVFDSHHPFASPHHLGDPIPIEGDAVASHDENTHR